MIRMPKFRWDIIWLPVAPLSSAGVCLHVDRLLNESSEEVRKFRNYIIGEDYILQIITRKDEEKQHRLSWIRRRISGTVANRSRT
ncbi:hypothetical protein AKJ16_DCAP01789 [Drosera capensis]